MGLVTNFTSDVEESLNLAAENLSNIGISQADMTSAVSSLTQDLAETASHLANNAISMATDFFMNNNGTKSPGLAFTGDKDIANELIEGIGENLSADIIKYINDEAGLSAVANKLENNTGPSYTSKPDIMDI